jgi:hypothetical protein
MSMPNIFAFLSRFPGTVVMIFKIFSLKNSAKKLAFLTQNKAKLCKHLIITLVFEKNANFFAENWRKSQDLGSLESINSFLSGKLFPLPRCYLISVFHRFIIAAASALRTLVDRAAPKKT